MSNEALRKKMDTAVMVKIAILSAMGFSLTFFEIYIPIFPPFLKLDFSQLPVLIGGLAMGPIAAVLIELIKNVVCGLLKSTTNGIGEMANFFMGCAYIVPLILIYRKKKSTVSFIIGAVAGTVVMTVVACLLNYYLLIPLYAELFFHKPVSFIVDMSAKVNGLVTSLEMLIVFAVAPFNLLKATAISITGYILYRALRPVMKFNFSSVPKS